MTPLVISLQKKALGLVLLKDVVKPGIRDRLRELKTMGIRTIMCTGDNRLTAAAIARESGVDEFVAEAKPETKLRLVDREKAQGRLVAMSGDGTNDAPALARADVGLAMNSGTGAAKEAGNMVDLDNDPTKLIELVSIGKQLLITRGALTTFSITNDVAKYFAIIPAIFIASGAGALPGVSVMNVLGLTEPPLRRPGRPSVQRAHHPVPHPSRADRGPVPAAQRHRPPAAQPAVLRVRGSRERVRRDQALLHLHRLAGGGAGVHEPRRRTRPLPADRRPVSGPSARPGRGDVPDRAGIALSAGQHAGRFYRVGHAPATAAHSLAGHLRVAAAFIVLMVLVSGFAYPALVTGIASVIDPGAAGGSLIRYPNGTVEGSETWPRT